MSVHPLPKRRMNIPYWSATVGQMTASEGVRVRGTCAKCKRDWPLDPAFLAREKGPFWTLWGRQLRCSKCGGEAVIQASEKLGSAFRVLNSGEATRQHPDVKRLHGRCGWCGGPR